MAMATLKDVSEPVGTMPSFSHTTDTIFLWQIYILLINNNKPSVL